MATYDEIRTTTYERWLTRQHNKFDSWWNSNQSSNSHADTSSRLKPPFDYIVDRVKREHPGKFKNNLEVRKQGVEPARMYSILKLGPRSRASTGRNGH